MFNIDTDFKLKYKIRKKIGEGSYGKVYSANKYAAKKFKTGNEINFKNIYEIASLKKLKHRNIAELIETFYNSKTCELILVMPLYYGSLFDLIKQVPLNKICIDITKGVKFIHENGFIHRDLKPDNILVTKNLTAKIIDFGFCKYVCDINKFVKRNSRVFQHINYRAPELLDSRDYYNYKIDVWSLACIFRDLHLSRSPSFSSKTVINQKKEIANALTSLKAEKSDFSEKLLKIFKIQTRKRPDCNGVLSILTGNKKGNLEKKNFKIVYFNNLNTSSCLTRLNRIFYYNLVKRAKLINLITGILIQRRNVFPETIYAAVNIQDSIFLKLKSLSIITAIASCFIALHIHEEQDISFKLFKKQVNKVIKFKSNIISFKNYVHCLIFQLSGDIFYPTVFDFISKSNNEFVFYAILYLFDLNYIKYSVSNFCNKIIEKNSDFKNRVKNIISKISNIYLFSIFPEYNSIV